MISVPYCTIILTHSSNDPSYELGLNKLELYSVHGVNGIPWCKLSFFKMSWEDKFNTYLHKITENTTTGLISDEKAERIKNMLWTQVFSV